MVLSTASVSLIVTKSPTIISSSLPVKSKIIRFIPNFSNISGIGVSVFNSSIMLYISSYRRSMPFKSASSLRTIQS